MIYKGQPFISFFDQGLNNPDWTLVGFSENKAEESEFVEPGYIRVSLAHCAEAGEAFDLLGLSPKEMADKIQLLKKVFPELQAAIKNCNKAEDYERGSMLSRLIEIEDRFYKILALNY